MNDGNQYLSKVGVRECTTLLIVSLDEMSINITYKNCKHYV